MATAAAETEDEATHPSAAADLIGHAEAEQQMLQAYNAGRIPHAWLIDGPRGVGKATLAYRFARFLLRHGGEGGDLFGAAPADLSVDPDDPIFRRVAAAGHGDLVTVARTARERSDELSAFIRVEQIRDLVHFFNLTSAEGGWRIAVIDAVDDLNANAENALLKLLEEPPARGLLLLVSHSPGRLLPTTRSRCRRLTLKPLAEADVAAILGARLPDLAPEDVTALTVLAEGSPGRAIALAEQGGVAVYRELIDLAGTLPNLNYDQVHQLSDRLNRRDGEAQYRVWLDLIGLWLTRTVRRGALTGTDMPEVVPGERALADRLAAGGALDRLVDLWEKISSLTARADAVHLERKQVVLNAFLSLESATRR